MTTKINVCLRMRPLLGHEVEDGHVSEQVEMDEEKNHIRVYNDKNKTCKEFHFDKVIPSHYTQEQLLTECKIPQLIDKVVDGYHATIFAYGQTGAGKTFTMEGYQYDNNEKHPRPIIEKTENIGIIPRAVNCLFDQLQNEQDKNTNKKFSVYCSYLQIYNEKIFDLLNPTQFLKSNPYHAGLKLRYKYNMFAVENLYTFECKSKKDVLDLFHFGINNRFVATHKLNHASSRAHSILTITIEAIDLTNPDDYVVSKLQLVDLAGSERSSITGGQSRLARESIEINKSLFTLRQVIIALTDSKSQGKPLYVPYRDSKLTCLLRQSIGGNSYCLMISCLSPSDKYFDENVSTLSYSSKAAFIANKPIRNEDPKTRLINELKMQVKDLTKQLKTAKDQIGFLLLRVEKEADGKLTKQETVGSIKKAKPTDGRESMQSELETFLDPLPLNHLQEIAADFKNEERGGAQMNPSGAATSPAKIKSSQQPSNSSPNANANGKEIATSEEKSKIENINNTNGKLTINNNYNSNVIAVINNKNKDTNSFQTATNPNIGNTQASPNFDIFMNQKNENSDKNTELLSKLTRNLENDKDDIMDRLLQSVTMVKEVLQSNLQLRENNQDLHSQVEHLNADLFHFQCENDDLKEKLQIISSIDNRDSLIGNMNLYGEESFTKSPKHKLNIANQIVRLKKDKTNLENRVKELEIENINMQKSRRASNSNLDSPSREGDDFEPVRSVLNMDEIRKSRVYKTNSLRSSKKKTSIKFVEKPPKPSSNKIPKTSYAKMRSSREREKDHFSTEEVLLEKMRMSSTQRTQHGYHNFQYHPQLMPVLHPHIYEHDTEEFGYLPDPTPPRERVFERERDLEIDNTLIYSPGIPKPKTTKTTIRNHSRSTSPSIRKKSLTHMNNSAITQNNVCNVVNTGEDTRCHYEYSQYQTKLEKLEREKHHLNQYNKNNLINMNKIPNKYLNYNTSVHPSTSSTSHSHSNHNNTGHGAHGAHGGHTGKNANNANNGNASAIYERNIVHKLIDHHNVSFHEKSHDRSHHQHLHQKQGHSQKAPSKRERREEREREKEKEKERDNQKERERERDLNFNDFKSMTFYANEIPHNQRIVNMNKPNTTEREVNIHPSRGMKGISKAIKIIPKNQINQPYDRLPHINYGN